MLDAILDPFDAEAGWTHGDTFPSRVVGLRADAPQSGAALGRAVAPIPLPER
jgi:hypothetical protein